MSQLPEKVMNQEKMRESIPSQNPMGSSEGSMSRKGGGRGRSLT